MKIKNKKRFLFWLASAVAVIAALSVGIAYAVWENTTNAQDVTEIPSDTWNTSLKSQVFALLDAENNIIKLPDTLEHASAVAFVGYTGLETELVIPDAVALKAGGGNKTLNVTKVLTLPEGGGGAILFRDSVPYVYPGQDIGLRNNLFVTALTLPKSVVYVASGAFSSMRELSILTVAGTAAIAIGDNAFSNCPNLTKLEMTRPLSATSNYARIFVGTPLVDPK